MFLPLQEKLNPYWKEEFNCFCKTRTSWYPIEWREEGRKNTRRTKYWLKDRTSLERMIDWLIDVPSFPRKVEPLLKGGIQLLLQNKDILVPNWMKGGRKEEHKTNKILAERQNDPRTNDRLIDWCSFLCKKSWTLTERRNSTAPAEQGHLWHPLEWRKERTKERTSKTSKLNWPKDWTSPERLIDWLIDWFVVGWTDRWISFHRLIDC